MICFIWIKIIQNDIEKFTETHNEAERWLRRYHKNDIKDSIYPYDIVVVFFRLR